MEETLAPGDEKDPTRGDKKETTPVQNEKKATSSASSSVVTARSRDKAITEITDAGKMQDPDGC